MMSAIATVLGGAGLCTGGYVLYQRAGPCTVHLGLMGLLLIVVGAHVGRGGLLRLLPMIL